MARHSMHPAQVHPRVRLGFLIRIAVCVLIFVWAPTIAQAAFSSTSAAALQVGTYSIPDPDNVTGTFSCTGTGRSMTVNLTDITPVNRATSYTVTLTAPSGQVTTNSVGTNPRTTTITRSSTSTGRYTLRVRANVGTWTGQNLERVLTCPN